ncbi:MAG TPA: M23 family metallopeptidase [Thermodesulfobacteriota bacterium]
MKRLSVEFITVLVVLALLGVALARLADAADEALPPKLSVEAAARRAKQGAIVPITIRSDRPLARLALVHGDRTVPVELTEGGMLGRALLGIDMDAPLGDQPLRLEATADDGAAAPVTYSLEIVSGRFRVQRLRVKRGYVELPPGVLERVRADQAAVARVWATGDPERRWRGRFLAPIEATPSDNFGVRRIFNGQPRAPHNGVDFGAPAGTPVVAPAAGRVALADDLYFSGGTIILDHGAGLFTTYFHLSRLDVRPGDLVRQGQAIGAVGSTGRSTGPHLHWGARLHGARVNPLDLLALPDWDGEPIVADSPPAVPAVPAAATSGPAAAPAAAPAESPASSAY